MMTIGDPRHEFIRVRDGVREPEIHLRSSIDISGEIFQNDMRLYPNTVRDLELFLDLAEQQLARAVGDKIVRGINHDD